MAITVGTKLVSHNRETLRVETDFNAGAVLGLSQLVEGVSFGHIRFVKPNSRRRSNVKIVPMLVVSLVADRPKNGQSVNCFRWREVLLSSELC